MSDIAKDTLVLHTGFEYDQFTGAVSVPIYQVSTFQQDALGRNKGYLYSRTGNPTREALENTIAVLEHGARGLAFASGLAAITTVLLLFSSGDHLVISDVTYGGTYRLITKVFNRLGISATFVDTTDLEAVKAAITPQTKAIFLETPANPLMHISDIQGIADICKTESLKLIVDNTFMTPYWQNPLLLGADIVVHSATKYLGGHSDVLAGLVVAASAEIGEELYFLQKSTGAVLAPQDSWLVMRGIKTLGVRMEKHEKNTRQLAQWLATLPEVKKVYYPGFQDHPQYHIAKNQARGFGGMISFELASVEVAERFFGKLKLITFAISLGGVESLISLPAKTTHAAIPPEVRKSIGISDSLVRFSVGIENVEELREDILQALR